MRFPLLSLIRYAFLVSTVVSELPSSLSASRSVASSSVNSSSSAYSRSSFPLSRGILVSLSFSLLVMSANSSSAYSRFPRSSSESSLRISSTSFTFLTFFLLNSLPGRIILFFAMTTAAPSMPANIATTPMIILPGPSMNPANPLNFPFDVSPSYATFRASSASSTSFCDASSLTSTDLAFSSASASAAADASVYSSIFTEDAFDIASSSMALSTASISALYRSSIVSSVRCASFSASICSLERKSTPFIDRNASSAFSLKLVRSCASLATRPITCPLSS